MSWSSLVSVCKRWGLPAIFATALSGCDRIEIAANGNQSQTVSKRTLIRECADLRAAEIQTKVVKVNLDETPIEFPCRAYRPHVYALDDESYSLISFSSFYSNGQFCVSSTPCGTETAADVTGMPGRAWISKPGSSVFWSDIESAIFTSQIEEENLAIAYWMYKDQPAAIITDANDATGVIMCPGLQTVEELQSLIGRGQQNSHKSTAAAVPCILRLRLETDSTFDFKLMPSRAYLSDLPESLVAQVNYLRTMGF